MSRRAWGSTLLAGGAVLILCGWFALGFLGEPSVVERLRVLLIGIGAGLVVLGLAGGVAGAWMLISRRT